MLRPRASPPDHEVLHFESSTRLDPANYTGPRQLLDKTGIVLSGWLPNWLIVPAIAVALYLLFRVGKLVDVGVLSLVQLLHRKKAAPRLSAGTIVAEGASVNQAVHASLEALAIHSVDDIDIVVLQSPHQPIFGPNRPARVQVRVKSASHSDWGLGDG